MGLLLADEYRVAVVAGLDYLLPHVSGPPINLPFPTWPFTSGSTQQIDSGPCCLLPLQYIPYLPRTSDLTSELTLLLMSVPHHTHAGPQFLPLYAAYHMIRLHGPGVALALAHILLKCKKS